MRWITIVFGLLGLAGFGLLFVLVGWLVRLGKKTKEAEYDKERVILLDKHHRSIHRWAKDVDRLVEEEKKLKAEVRGDPSLGNVVDVLRRAHGSDDLPTTDKPDAT